jgi:hypothetical protein
MLEVNLITALLNHLGDGWSVHCQDRRMTESTCLEYFLEFDYRIQAGLYLRSFDVGLFAFRGKPIPLPNLDKVRQFSKPVIVCLSFLGNLPPQVCVLGSNRLVALSELRIKPD